MGYTFPEGYFDDSRHVLSKLGSIWNDIYGGSGLVRDIIAARLQIDKQTFADLEEAVQSLSRKTVPVYHQETWYSLDYLESEMNTGTSALWRLDSGHTFDLSGLRFDIPLTDEYYTFDKPTELADVYYIADALEDPSVIWIRGIDFILNKTANALVFRENPFTAGFAYNNVYADGEVTDKQLTMWLFRASIDKDRLYRHFGYLLGFDADSSIEYRNAINAALDAIVAGTAQEQILYLIAALVGIPLVSTDTETVVDVAEDRNHKLVITNQAVYKFNKTATITVSNGDVVYKGQSLVSDFEIVELARGELSSNVKAIALGGGFLSSDFSQEIVLQNTVQNVETTGSGDARRLTFPITGHPLEVDYFWDIVHLRRLTYGSSLYQLLDATASGVPLTINPAEFFAENVLRNNALIIRLSQAGFSSDAIGLWPGFLIRKLMPPRSALILIIEMLPLADIAYNEYLTDSEADVFLSLPVLSDDVNSVDEECLTGKLYTFTCQ